MEPAARQEFGELLLDEMGGDCEVDGSWHATDFGLPIDTQIHHFGDCPEVGELLIFVTVIDDPAMFLAAYAFAPDGGEIELLKEILSSIRVAGSFSGVRP